MSYRNFREALKKSPLTKSGLYVLMELNEHKLFHIFHPSVKKPMEAIIFPDGCNTGPVIRDIPSHGFVQLHVGLYELADKGLMECCSYDDMVRRAPGITDIGHYSDLWGTLTENAKRYIAENPSLFQDIQMKIEQEKQNTGYIASLCYRNAWDTEGFGVQLFLKVKRKIESGFFVEVVPLSLRAIGSSRLVEAGSHLYIPKERVFTNPDGTYDMTEERFKELHGLTVDYINERNRLDSEKRAEIDALNKRHHEQALAARSKALDAIKKVVQK